MGYLIKHSLKFSVLIFISLAIAIVYYNDWAYGSRMALSVQTLSELTVSLRILIVKLAGIVWFHRSCI